MVLKFLLVSYVWCIPINPTEEIMSKAYRMNGSILSNVNNKFLFYFHSSIYLLGKSPQQKSIKSDEKYLFSLKHQLKELP